MICKDCEANVVKVNREGICPACYKRKTQSKYLGKEYIKVKDLANIDMHAYKIAMSRRKVYLAEEPKEQVTKIIVDDINKSNKEKLSKLLPQVETKPTDLKEQCYEVVLKDAKAKFKQEHLDINFFKDIDLKGFLRTFTELLYNTNIFEDSRKAEEIFNGLSIDYDHYLEQVDWSENALKNVYGLKKALLEIRRPNQTFQYNYNLIKDILKYLKQDDKFLRLLDRTREKVEDNEPSIYGARASELVAAQDFATKRNIYRCEVEGHNYYGEQGRRTFTRDFEAISEENAKEMLNRFLAEQFSSFQYNQKDIKIIKI